MRGDTKAYWCFTQSVIAVFYCSMLCCSGSAEAQTGGERAQAESRLEGVRKEIGVLQKSLARSRVKHANEHTRLREIDLQIQAANLELRTLEKRRQSHLRELAGLERQRNEYLIRLKQRHDQLVEQIRASYRLDNQSRLKLILNQDSPAQLSRMLAYYDYINRAQVAKISGLRKVLTKLNAMQQSIDQELSRLETVQTEQRKVMDQLDQQRKQRRTLLEELEEQIDDEESRLTELERNQQDLETLLELLSDVLADIPADLGKQLGVARQKGRIPMPVKGRVRHAFGHSRGGGLRWQGWLIAAAAGSEVSAIAYGRVAFADWLRGYGLLIIIDHGEGFMSLYGHNESLLYEAGDWVEPGKIISVIGVRTGNDQGLYFELRKNGKSVDPAAWLAR
ncbi:MAG: peptidoglycan DD-metalloendopeptidase family protein [Xanthomonadales bacterium]